MNTELKVEEKVEEKEELIACGIKIILSLCLKTWLNLSTTLIKN